MQIRYSRAGNDLYDSRGTLLASVSDYELQCFMEKMAGEVTLKDLMCAYLGFVIVSNLLRRDESPMVSFVVDRLLRCD